MSLVSGFNANEVEPRAAMVPLPAGDYIGMIVNTEEKATSAGTGMFLSLTLEVCDGEHTGRKLFENLNLRNPSEDAVKIARSTLSAICRAVGVMTPHEAVELCNIPMKIKVGIEKRKDTGELQNRIKGYAKLGEASAAGALHQSALPTQAVPAVGGGQPAPWMRKPVG